MTRKWQVCVGSAALIFGLICSQILPGKLQAQADPNSKNQTLVETIKQMERDIAGMEQDLASLREETDRLQNNEAGDRDISRNIQTEIRSQEAAAGLTELSGEGIIITLDDNSKGASAAKANDPVNYRPNDFIIHDKNLLYLVNELKQAKAQGIAINNQRIATSSHIRCVGTVIMVNSTRVAPPFEISAVGSAKKLKQAVEKGREYHYLKENNFPVEVRTADKLVLPAYTGSLNPKYMTSPASEQETGNKDG